VSERGGQGGYGNAICTCQVQKGQRPGSSIGVKAKGKLINQESEVRYVVEKQDSFPSSMSAKESVLMMSESAWKRWTKALHSVWGRDAATGRESHRHDDLKVDGVSHIIDGSWTEVALALRKIKSGEKRGEWTQFVICIQSERA
jgi:hypothetical protein